MLLAYDINKNQPLLSLAEKLFEWLCDQVKNSDAIYLLNKFQSIKRKRDLTSEEYSEIEKIRNIDDPELVFGSYILLGNEEAALDVFSRFQDERKVWFAKTPIINLLSQENREKIIIGHYEEGSKNG